jgi:hypothetical protein
MRTTLYRCAILNRQTSVGCLQPLPGWERLANDVALPTGLEMAGGAMSCLSCMSNDQAEFAAEMIIHFFGLKNLDNPGIWVFPKLLVCLDCGFSPFTVPKSELPLIAKCAAARETLTLDRRLENLALHGRIALGRG